MSRQDMAVMLFRCSEKLNLDTSARGGLAAYSDASEVSEYAQDAMGWAVGAGLLRGAFDSLPGAGKPLELEDDSHIPEDLRMAYKLLKNAGYVPEEVLDRKEAQSIVDALEKCGDEQEKVRQMKKLEVVIARIKARHPNAPVLGDGSPYYERVVCRITVNKKD